MSILTYQMNVWDVCGVFWQKIIMPISVSITVYSRCSWPQFVSSRPSLIKRREKRQQQKKKQLNLNDQKFVCRFNYDTDRFLCIFSALIYHPLSLWPH